MDYDQIAILFLQGTFVAFILLLLFRIRKQFGIGVLLACLALFQFLQIFISSSVYVSITNNFLVSPGSTVLFTGTLFTLLIIYIKEDASEIKKVIYTLLIVNIVMTIILLLFGLNLNETAEQNSFNTLSNIFDNRDWILFVSTITLFLDSLLIIILFEFIAKHVRFLFLQIFLTMLVVVSFDTLFYTIIAFWSFDNLSEILQSRIISKGIFALFYSVLFYLYLKYFDSVDASFRFFKIKDVFQPLTYKQKFESAKHKIKIAKAQRELELLESNKEKERRIKELELSQQKVQEAFELLEKREYSLNEASKVAKIGYWEYDSLSDTFLWSDYVHLLFGSNPKEKPLSYKDIIATLDKESQKKLVQANQTLTKKGISYDIELKLINLKNEEIWIRDLAQPVFNEQNKIIGRRGVLQNITDIKKNREVLKQSKKELEESLKIVQRSDFLLRNAGKMAKIGAYELFPEEDLFYFSEQVLTIFGIKEDSTLPLKQIEALFLGVSNSKMQVATENLTTFGTPFDLEFDLFNLNKEHIWVRIIVEPIYNEDKKVIGRRGVIKDISDIKLTQLELESSNMKLQDSLELSEKRGLSLKEASKMAKIGYWEYDAITDTMEWSDYIHQLYGSDPKKPLPPLTDIIAFFSKESKKILLEANEKLINKGVPYDIELNLFNLNEQNLWIRNVVQPVFNEEYKVIGRRGVLQDITEKKLAQIELENFNNKLQDSLELAEKKDLTLKEASKLAKIGYWEYDAVNDIVEWSEYIHQIYGSDPKKPAPLQKDIVALFSKESQKRLIKANKNLINNATSYDLEFKLTNLNQQTLWIRNVVQPVFDENNIVIGRRGVLQDITASKLVQLELEYSKNKLQDSLELLEKSEQTKDDVSQMAKIGYWQYDFKTDKLTWSDYLHVIYGSDPKKGTPSLNEVINSFDKESQEKLVQANTALADNGTSYELELKSINLKGEEVWIRNVVQPIYNEQNEVIGRSGVIQDITAAKITQIELELSRSKLIDSLELVEKNEYLLREASRMAKIGHWGYDNHTSTIFWSDELHKMYGTDPKKDVPKIDEILSLFDEKSRKKLIEATFNLSNFGIPYNIVLHMINFKKESCWIRNIGEPVYNEDNKIIGRRGVSQNITERKQIEEKNLLIKEDYKRLFDNVTISIWNEDLTLVFEHIEELQKLDIPDFKIYLEQHPDVLASLITKVKVNSVNNASLKLFKVTKEQEILTNIEKFSGEGADKVFANFIEAIWNDEKAFTSEIKYKTLEGDEFAAIVSIPIPETVAKQKTVPVSIQSIQKIKEAELEKKESLKKLKEAQKLAQVGNWSYNILTQESEWSDEIFNIWGFDSNKPIPNYDIVNSRIHPEDLNFFRENFDNATRLGTPYDIEYRLSLPNGEEKWVRAICKPVLGKHKELESITGTNQDITEKKRISQKVQEAQELYRLLTDNANDIICLQNKDSSFKFISPSLKSILGYETSDFIGKKVFHIVHKDDIKPLQDAIKKKVFNASFKEAFSFRIRHKDGHYVWLEFLTSPVYEADKISYFVTSARDVTQWILAKEEIQKYQTSLQKLTTEITLIEEMQKKEIATNIHDHLSQSLVISKMKIKDLKKNPDLQDINEGLQFIETHISEALSNSRKITYELSPPILYQLGIIEALNWLLEEVETTYKIKYELTSNITTLNLDEVESILLYRSIQEIVTNTIKYAKATLITLDINKLEADKHRQTVIILISDDGVGFDTSTLNSQYQNRDNLGSGFGLFTVQERIKNIQGEFTIVSDINIGTTVEIVLPLNK